MGSNTIAGKLLYREAMIVNEIRAYVNGCMFPICPRCNRTMDREYQSFCDRCGQKLKWTGFSKAKIRWS